MKKALKALAAAAVLASASVASATPSTVVWTPATTYTQPFLVPHITYDTYFGERHMLQETLGLTVGFVPDNKWFEGEIGADAMYPLLGTPQLDDSGAPRLKYETKSAFLFNGKVSLKEGALHQYAPGLSVGAFGLGLTKDVTNYNISYAVLGKTIGAYGTVAAGGFVGNKKLLWKPAYDASTHAISMGKKDYAGFMASYASPKLTIDTVGLKGVSLGVDYMSGDSAFGALGAAATFYFTDAISLLTGPVFFNDKYSAFGLNQATAGQKDMATPSPSTNNMVWTVQLDVDIDFAKPKPAAK